VGGGGVQNKEMRSTPRREREKQQQNREKFIMRNFNNLYSLLNSIIVIDSRRMRCGYVARMREMKNEYKILLGNPESKKKFGRPGRRWEDNIKTDLQEIRLKV
jgi:hypothetical protein